MLQRAENPMPDWVADALDSAGMRGAFDARPPYQRNDYLGWIVRAKREQTQQKRLAQMLDELGRGDVYMKMEWSPQRTRGAE